MPRIYIEQFFNELNKKSIRYVHWKSNTNIDAALENEDDLDILIHPDDKEEAEAEAFFSDYEIVRARFLRQINGRKIFITFTG